MSDEMSSKFKDFQVGRDISKMLQNATHYIRFETDNNNIKFQQSFPQIDSKMKINIGTTNIYLQWLWICGLSK